MKKTRRSPAILLAAVFLPALVLHAEDYSAVCALDKYICGEYSDLSTKLGKFEQSAKTKKKTLKPEQVEGLVLDILTIEDDANFFLDAIHDEGKKSKATETFLRPLIPLWNRTKSITLASINPQLKHLEDELTELEKGIAEIEEKSNAGTKGRLRVELGAKLVAINRKVAKLWPKIQLTGVNIDYMGPKSIKSMDKDGKTQFKLTDTAPLTTRMNAIQQRFATLKNKIMSADRTLGTGLSPPTEGVKEVAGRSKKNLKGKLNDPFMVREIPKVDPGDDSVEPVNMRLAEDNSDLPFKPVQRLVFKEVPIAVPPLIKRPPPPPQDMYPMDTLKMKAMKLFGLTQTVGDPEERAKFVFHQDGSTCGIASQVVMKTERDKQVADPSTMKQQENRLYTEALARGFFSGKASDPNRRANGGTPWQHMGNLLDQPIKKRFGATAAEFDKSVLTGKMLLVNANSGKLWNDPRFANGGHIFVVTGAEVENSTGKVMGYYINDTGTNQGGRYITSRQFLEAWKSAGSYYVEPL